MKKMNEFDKGPKVIGELLLPCKHAKQNWCIILSFKHIPTYSRCALKCVMHISTCRYYLQFNAEN